MALPINIHELIHGSTVEWERREFKAYLSDMDVGDMSPGKPLNALYR